MMNAAVPQPTKAATTAGSASTSHARAQAIITGQYEEPENENARAKRRYFEREQSSNGSHFLLDIDRFSADSQVWLLASIVYALDRIAQHHGVGFSPMECPTSRAMGSCPGCNIHHFEMLPAEHVIWSTLEREMAVAHYAMSAPKTKPGRRIRYARGFIQSGESSRWITAMRESLMKAGFAVSRAGGSISRDTGYQVATELYGKGFRMYDEQDAWHDAMIGVLVDEINLQGYHFSRWEATRFVPSLDLQHIEEVLARAEAQLQLKSAFQTELRVQRELKTGQAAMRLMAFLTALKSQGYGLIKTDPTDEASLI